MATVIVGLILITIGFSALIGVSLFKFVFSLLLIILGLSMISGRRRWFSNIETSSNEDFVHEVAIFSPINKVVNSQNFRGGRVIAVFGGGQVDLSGVKTSQKELKLEIVAVFGGCKLIIPKEWKVNSQGTAIFGGYNSRAAQGTGDILLNIKGAAVFGGVDIVNQ